MILNQDCIEGAKENIPDKSIDLLICDPPFGIDESSFGKHYFRDKEKVLDGYQEAPVDYLNFTRAWLEQAKRVLKDTGSLYIVSGWSNLDSILIAAKELDLFYINHIIWKFNFGVNTKNKFVSSHYHILYFKKDKKSKVTFNKNCRFGDYEVNKNGGKLLYQDLEDVWNIKKDYCSGEIKNSNKLPNELVKKMILYSSNENDKVCDFFLGNFTTAIVAKSLGRDAWGFEINKLSCEYFIPILNNTTFGYELDNLRIPDLRKPVNQGKPLSEDEKTSILNSFDDLLKDNTKQKTLEILIELYGRGRWSLERIIKNREPKELSEFFLS